MDRRQVLRGVGAGVSAAWAAPSILSVVSEGALGSAPCPFTLVFESGGTAPNRFVEVTRDGVFDCGPRSQAVTRLEFVGGAVFAEGILRVPEDEDFAVYPVSIQAMCFPDSADLGCPARTFQSFEELFQAG
jgi:hypothetical protein